ncbi:PilZ domain-containing protein [Bacteriovorax sp. DB6_IX]|uniref:PilZ domain-containing protein n=1 Tax=Bacteriovorax sp. DB6_IX TaxID=1353530 RepID=UPI00038A2E8D|nr:PilZ domain-containing protein [Bacteriovorax sp. DB6_IX]EQC51326.1 type IV pilus assembly protein PilZ [Bacteriovorax sp. DB6_IX]
MIFKLFILTYMLIPLATLAIAALRLELDFEQTKNLVNLSISKKHILSFWGAPLISAFCLINVRAWSYFIFMGAQIFMFIGPHLLKNYAPEIIHMEAILPIYMTQAFCLFGIYKFTDIKNRSSFFDPSLRWWERSKRYHLPLPMSLKSHHIPSVLDTTVVNISTTGIFFINNSNRVHEFQKGEKFLANISFQDVELSIPIRIVRKGKFENFEGWGAQFSKQGLWHRIYLLKLIKQVESMKRAKIKFHKEEEDQPYRHAS